MNHSRLGLPIIKDSNRRADRIAVRLRAFQMKSNAPRVCHLIVAVKIRGSIVSGQQNVQVTVAIEIAISQSAPHFRRFETSSCRSRDILKFSAAAIQEKLRRLRVTDVPANVSNGFVDVAVRDRQVEISIEIDIQEETAESQSIF